MEVVGHRLDHLAGHLQFGRLDLHLLVEPREVGVANLVGPQQRVHHHDVALGEVLHSQRGQARLVPQREVHDRDPIGLCERLRKQHIRFRRLRVGLQEIATVVHQRIDLAGGYELQHLDLAAALLGQRCDVLVGDHHGLAVVGFVRLGDVAILHDLTAHLTDALVADPAVVLGVHLVELQVVVFGGAIHLDGNVHQTERDRAFPNGTHQSSMPSARTDIPSLSVREGQHGRRRGSQRKVLRLVERHRAEGKDHGKVERKDRGRDVGIRARKGAGNATQRLQRAANRSLLRLRRAFARISHLARGAAGNQVLRIGRSCGRCSHSGEYQGADSESDHWPRLAAGNTLGW